MEKRLWDPRGYYLNYFDPETGQKSDYVFGYQMDGEWITDQHGLPGALPADRVRTVLETIKRTNITLSKSGAVNYARADRSLYRAAEKGTWDYGAYSYFPPEALMLAMEEARSCLVRPLTKRKRNHARNAPAAPLTVILFQFRDARWRK